MEYVLQAIEWIADNGKMFLPAYGMDYKSGEWRWDVLWCCMLFDNRKLTIAYCPFSVQLRGTSTTDHLISHTPLSS